MRAFALLALATLSSAVAVFACTSTDEVTGNQADGGADGAGVEPDAATSGSDADTDGGPRDLGFVFASSDSFPLEDGGSTGQHRAGAHFSHTTGTDTTVTSKTVGPCLVEKFGSGDPADESARSAGALHITGGTKTVDLVPKADKTYDAVTGSVALWNGGETLKVSGDGKDVPAFTVSLVAPSKLTLTAPTFASPGSLTVTRSAPFSATWNAGASGFVVLYFDAATESNGFAATCTFDASAGTAQVPAAVFADFPAADGTFDFYAKSVAETSPEGWTIRFTASSELADPSGAGTSGTATFQ